MAFTPVTGLNPQYDEQDTWWLKFYKPETTTPIAMATSATGETQLAKAQLDVDGFITTDGTQLFIPFVDQSYDAYLFPTEAEADANDTINAKRIAENINPFGLGFEQEVNYYPFEVSQGLSVFNIPDMPKGVVLVKDGDTQEQGISGGDVKDFVYDATSGNISVTVPMTGNEQLFAIYGAIVPIKSTLPEGVKSFDTVSEYVNDLNNSVGDIVVTRFYSSEVLCRWITTDAGLGAGDMSDGTLNLTGSNLQARLLIESTMTPKHFGALATGFDDDSQSVQYCMDNSPRTIIDSKYGINIIKVTGYVTCEGGEFVYVGGFTSPLTKSIELVGVGFGDIIYDANNQELQAVFSNDGSHTKGNYIEVRNMFTPSLAANTPIAIIIAGGSKLSLDRARAENFTQGTGFDNGSVPQFIVASGDGSFVEVNDATGYQVRAGLLADQLGEISVNSYTHEESFDQAIYNFSGTTRVGNLYHLNSNEEVIVNAGGFVYVDDLLMVGRCFAFLRLQGAKHSYIGKVHATYPRGTADEEISNNVCRGFINHRIGNVGKDSGDVYIGSITGQFTETLVRTGEGSGTTSSIQIDSVDIDWLFNEDASGFSYSNFLNFTGAKKLSIGNFDVRIHDVFGAATSGNTRRFDDAIYNSNLELYSYINRMTFTIYDENGSIHPYITYQGQPGSSLCRFNPKNHVWQTNVGPYRREVTLGSDGGTVNNTAPSAGYWKKGDRLPCLAWDGSGITEDLFVCTAEGAPGTWVTRTVP